MCWHMRVLGEVGGSSCFGPIKREENTHGNFLFNTSEKSAGVGASGMIPSGLRATTVWPPPHSLLGCCPPSPWNKVAIATHLTSTNTSSTWRNLLFLLHQNKGLNLPPVFLGFASIWFLYWKQPAWVSLDLGYESICGPSFVSVWQSSHFNAKPLATEKWAGRGMNAGGDPTGSALGDNVKQEAGRITRSHITSPQDSFQTDREMRADFQADL